MALVPAKARARGSRAAYVLHDSQGGKHEVDDEIASRIAPTAWVFYRLLADATPRVSDLIRFSLGRGTCRASSGSWSPWPCSAHSSV